MKVLGKLAQIDILASSCNPTTVRDGRGGIFTWVPEHCIQEFNLVIIKPEKIRGNHFHPEFIEYFLVVDGKLLLSTKDINTQETHQMLASSGMCFRTPMGISHSFQAITYSTCVSMLTKPWDQCEQPIISSPVL